MQQQELYLSRLIELQNQANEFNPQLKTEILKSMLSKKMQNQQNQDQEEEKKHQDEEQKIPPHGDQNFLGEEEEEDKFQDLQNIISQMHEQQNKQQNQKIKALINNTCAQQEEYDCPICFTLMFQPANLPCNHTFCVECLQDLINRYYNLSCPLCRGKVPNGYFPVINEKMQNKIKQIFPIQFQKNKARLQKLALDRCYKKQLEFIFGNRHEIVPNPKFMKSSSEFNKHKWTVFIRPASVRKDAKQYISKVVFGLHPSFGATEQIVRNQPFEMTKIGWGTFTVPITVHFHSWVKAPKLQLQHELSFVGKGKWRKCSVRVGIQKGKKGKK